MSVVFDKLAFVHTLEAEGEFSRGQAEALSEALHTAVSETVATKADLTSAIAEVRHEIAETRSQLRYEIALTRSELKLWMGSLAGALFAALGGLSVALRFLTH